MKVRRQDEAVVKVKAVQVFPSSFVTLDESLKPPLQCNFWARHGKLAVPRPAYIEVLGTAKF